MKKVILKGPVLTRSGYGEQARFALRSLWSRPDLYDVYIAATGWGKTSWIIETDSEREMIDNVINKTTDYLEAGGKFDMSVQVTIPNEWERIAPYNVGYTAGIETTRVAPEWIEKTNMMDKVVVVSNHAKNIFEESKYLLQNGDKPPVKFRCTTAIDVVNYPVKNFESVDLGLQLPYDFNFLCVAQWGPRKNVKNTVKWFVEEFHDEEVGLVVKMFQLKNCHMDKLICMDKLKDLLFGADIAISCLRPLKRRAQREQRSDHYLQKSIMNLNRFKKRLFGMVFCKKTPCGATEKKIAMKDSFVRFIRLILVLLVRLRSLKHI